MSEQNIQTNVVNSPITRTADGHLTFPLGGDRNVVLLPQAESDLRKWLAENPREGESVDAADNRCWDFMVRSWEKLINLIEEKPDNTQNGWRWNAIARLVDEAKSELARWNAAHEKEDDEPLVDYKAKYEAVQVERDVLKAELDALRTRGVAVNPPAPSETVEATAIESTLRNLLQGKYSSLTIGFNEDHAANYCVASDYSGYADKDSRIQWVSGEEKTKALRDNSVWTLQWYPVTPIGFHCIGASSLSELLKAAIAAEKAMGM